MTVPVTTGPAITTLATVVLKTPTLGSPLGRLLVAVVAIAAVVLIGRIVLAIAWRIVVVAAAVIAVLYLVSLATGVPGA